VDAVGDQRDFDFSFDATGPIAADDLYAFVATNLVPVFELELGKATPITVTIAPASASLAPNGTQQFAATVAGTTNAAVDWSASCGTISSSGLYTAPLTGPCTVTATSREWSSAKGSASATISGISVVVSPETATIVPSGQQQFTAEVTGIVNGAVVWSASCGTIDQAGLYTAPATDTVCTITATSQADPTRSGTATATIGELELVVSPEIAFVAPLGTRQFTATIGAAPADVDWGATCGSVDENGLFTAPSLEGTSSGRCLVFANLVTDPRIGGSASAYFGTPDAPTGNGDLSGYAFDNTFDSLCNGGPGGVSVSTATLAGTAPATQGGATQTSTIGIAPTLADNVLLIGGSVSSESHASADVGPGACDAPHAAYANGAASTFLTIVVRGGGVPYSLSASGALTADQTAGSNGSFAFVFEADSLTAGIVSEANGPYANGQIFTTNEYPDPIADHGWLWPGTYTLFVSAGSDATAVSGESGASSAASSSLQFELVIGVSP
jgi:mannose-6-phosphate isomerase-like protein (cupin superfamily)